MLEKDNIHLNVPALMPEFHLMRSKWIQLLKMYLLYFQSCISVGVSLMLISLEQNGNARSFYDLEVVYKETRTIAG